MFDFGVNCRYNYGDETSAMGGFFVLLPLVSTACSSARVHRPWMALGDHPAPSPVEIRPASSSVTPVLPSQASTMKAVHVAPVARVAKKTHHPWGRRSRPKEGPVVVKVAPKAKPSTAPIPSSNPAPTVAVEKPKPDESSDDSFAEQLDKKAKEYDGVRYRFGGETKKGFDCSGLVKKVYEELQQKKLPHAAKALYKLGAEVPESKLRAGDLIFFKNTYRRGISHVGIYMGKNKFLHASSKHGVTITPLSDPYYQLHYAGARRLY